MGFGFDLEGGMGDPVVVLKDAAGLIKDRMGIGGSSGHEVSGGDVHIGREGPHVEAVDVDHARKRAKFGLELVDVNIGRCGLDQDAEGLVPEPPGTFYPDEGEPFVIGPDVFVKKAPKNTKSHLHGVCTFGGEEQLVDDPDLGTGLLEFSAVAYVSWTGR